jgi:predicted Zn-dependent protease
MWTGQIRSSFTSISYLFLLVLLVGNEVWAQQPCTSIPALKIRAVSSIFGIEQERMLGDIEAQFVEENYPIVHDDESAAHLNAVARRIFSQLPPEQMRVRIILIDTPEPESFSVGPERIYLARKMIRLLKNDDELAGLLGHELGHILTHQNAIMVSELFHEILRVNSVSDRKDISEKFTRLLDTIDGNKKMLRKAAQVMERQEVTNQYEADRVAIFASAAAGFSPQAFLDLFERSAGTNGRTRNLMTDIFAATSSDERRLREIKKTLMQLPKPCREIAVASSKEFRTWQAAILSNSDQAAE